MFHLIPLFRHYSITLTASTIFREADTHLVKLKVLAVDLLEFLHGTTASCVPSVLPTALPLIQRASDIPQHRYAWVVQCHVMCNPCFLSTVVAVPLSRTGNGTKSGKRIVGRAVGEVLRSASLTIEISSLAGNPSRTCRGRHLKVDGEPPGIEIVGDDVVVRRLGADDAWEGCPVQQLAIVRGKKPRVS